MTEALVHGGAAALLAARNTTPRVITSDRLPSLKFSFGASAAAPISSRHRRSIPRLHVLAFLAGIFVSAEVDSLRTRLLQPSARRKTLSPIKSGR